MRDLAPRGSAAQPPHVPESLAFEIADPVLVKSCADHHNFRMLVCLECGAAVGDDYEEVIAFQTSEGLYRFIMWRNSEAVFVQPTFGKSRRFGSVASALSRLRKFV